MRLDYTKSALYTLNNLPARIRKTFYKQAGFLVQNLHYPSLRAKKYDESRDIWQARINDDWRFYFKIVDDTYLITGIKPHPK